MRAIPTLKEAIASLFMRERGERHIDAVRSRIAGMYPNRWRLNYEYVVKGLNDLARDGVLRKGRPGYFRCAGGPDDLRRLRPAAD